MTLIIKGKIPNIIKSSDELARTLPRKIGNLAERHYKEGFRLGGRRTNKSNAGWQRRKKKDKGRALLIKTGQLRNDFGLIKVEKFRIVLGTTITPYASFHNEGTEHIPQREFVGESFKLRAKIGKLGAREYKRIFDK